MPDGMLKPPDWANKVKKKEEGKYLTVISFTVVQKMFSVEIFCLI